MIKNKTQRMIVKGQPFCCKTEGLSDKEINILLLRFVELGADPMEGTCSSIYGVFRRVYVPHSYSYFGVSWEGWTYFENLPSLFNANNRNNGGLASRTVVIDHRDLEKLSYPTAALKNRYISADLGKE